jgi:hypothetical protein
MHLKPKLFPLIIFYDLYFLITKLLTGFSINLCTYISYHCIMVGVTVSIELLLSNDTGIVLSFVRVFCLSLCSCLLYNWSLGWWASMLTKKELLCHTNTQYKFANMHCTPLYRTSLFLQLWFNFTCIYLWIYSPLLDFGRFFSFLILYMDDQPVARPLATHTEQQKHRINAHRHPCFEWDSNPWSQYLSEDGSCPRLCGYCDR